MTQETKLYIIRHGKAEGNREDSPLTPDGKVQAKKLSDFLLQRQLMNIDRLISSPYLRAKQTAEVLATRLNIHCFTDDRLKEINFGNASDDVDLVEQLRKQFRDFNCKLVGGESNQEVMNRVGALKDELSQSGGGTFVLITHSVAMTLLLRHFDEERFGFNQWRELTNPDVYVVTLTNSNIQIENIWN